MTIKELSKTTNVKQELESSSLVANICNIFAYQKFSHETPTELPKHVHFRLTLDKAIHAKRPNFFLKSDFELTYMVGFDQSDNLFYQMAVLMSTEKEPI